MVLSGADTYESAESRQPMPALQLRQVTVDARMVRSSGIGTYIQNLLPRLMAADPATRFQILGGRELQAFEWTRGETVEWTECDAPIYSLREQLAVAARIDPASDLFWSPHYNVPLLHRGRLLVTVHDLAHLALPQFARAPHQRAYARLMFGAVRRATAKIFDSRFTANEYARLVGKSSGHDTVIHPGVDDAWFSIPTGAPPHARPYLLFVGNVKPQKNLGALLAAFGELIDEIPHDLVIVGRREGFIHGDSGVLGQAERLGDRVSLTGWVDDDRVKQYFAHADALIFPSFYEGFGLPPLEAMASGCPVIVSSAASLPEVCGNAALYCDPASPGSIRQQIRALLADSVLRAELVERGRERARTFTWDKCAEQTRQVIRAAAENVG
jgi:glycosyltransferase involved in cell wall biosynthesis